MEFWELLKGLEYEPGVERFWTRHEPRIRELWKQVQETDSMLYSNLTTPHVNFAIHRYLSTFDEFYELRGLLLRSAVHGFLHTNRKKLTPVGGTVKQYMEVNKGALADIYSNFRKLYLYERHRLLDQYFKYGVEDFMKAEGLLSQ